MNICRNHNRRGFMFELKEKLSIIMPAYNEEALIYNSIIQTLDIVEQFAPNLEVVAVNDGSSDNTRQEIERAAKTDEKRPHRCVAGVPVSNSSRVKLVTSKKNRGKGNAIIAGVSQAEGEYIAFVDADLELNPSQLCGYLEKMLATKSDVVIGCKFHKDSELKYPLRRRIISLGYYMMLLALFHLNVKDTQTGLKVFKAGAIKPVAHLIRTSGFAYDIELLAALNRRGCKIEQMPVKVVYVRDRNSRRIGMHDIIKAFNDTWAIFYRLYFKHYYD